MHALLYKYATWVSRFERGTQAEGYPRITYHGPHYQSERRDGLGTVSDNRLLGKIPGLKRDEVTKEWRKLQN
jgi:hypothetical protein